MSYAWAALLLLLCTPALAQNTKRFQLPWRGLPIFILVVIAGLVYWRVRRRARRRTNTAAAAAAPAAWRYWSLSAALRRV